MQEAGTQAVKFKLGAGLHRTAQSGARDANLIPLATRESGVDSVVYADAISSYDVPVDLQFGAMPQDQGYAIYEKPMRFDDFHGTSQMTRPLDIPLAGDEQESSLRRTEAMIRERVVDIVQPDIPTSMVLSVQSEWSV